MTVKSLYEKRFAHLEPDCPGEFTFQTIDNVHIWHDLRTLQQITYEMVVCYECQVAYLAPGFEEKIEREKSLDLLKQDRLLPQEFRFIRICLGLDQETLARHLGFSIFQVKMAERERGTEDKEVLLALRGLFFPPLTST